MSIWNFVFDSEFRQRADLEGLRNRLARSSAVGRVRIGQTAARIRALEDELAEAALLLRSLYVYLKEQPGFDAQRFAAIIDQIDTSDGVKDAKLTKRQKHA